MVHHVNNGKNSTGCNISSDIGLPHAREKYPRLGIPNMEHLKAQEIEEETGGCDGRLKPGTAVSGLRTVTAGKTTSGGITNNESAKKSWTLLY
jgi:phosphopentomutase